MQLEEDGQLVASEAITISNATLGNQNVVKTTFLERMRKLVAPEISELSFRLSGSVTGVGTTAYGKDACKLIKKAIARDDDEWLNAGGQSLRVLEQIDYGSKQKDPADVAAAATNASYKGIIKLGFRPPSKAHRPRDFHLPLVSLLDAGEFMIQIADAWPTGWATTTSLTLRIFARVVEGRKREVKARRQISEISFNVDDTTYPLGGSIRGLYLSSNLTTTGMTALTGITAVNSQSLEYPPDLPTDMLVDNYRLNSEALGTNDEIEAGNVIPFVCPHRAQKIGQMIDARNVHLKLGSTPTSAILIRDLIVDRPPEITAKSMGYGSAAEYQADLLEKGRVINGEKGGAPIRSFNPTLVRRLPARIPGDGGL